MIRQQGYARQEASLKAQFIEEYFKSKYQMEGLTKEEFNATINRFEQSWKKIENELVETSHIEEDNK